MKTAEQRHKETDELIAKFKNGVHLYRTDPIYHRIIQMMIDGMNIYDVIEHMLIITKSNRNAMEEMLARAQGNFYIKSESKSQ